LTLVEALLELRRVLDERRSYLKSFIAAEKLTAFMELESAIRSATRGKSAYYENLPPDRAAKPCQRSRLAGPLAKPFRGFATQLAPQSSQAEQSETEQA
jgi:hypothetical protein